MLKLIEEQKAAKEASKSSSAWFSYVINILRVTSNLAACLSAIRHYINNRDPLECIFRLECEQTVLSIGWSNQLFE